MFSKLFKTYTAEDLIAVLNHATFSESKANSILKDVKINYVNEHKKGFLHMSAENNSIEAITWLLSKKIDMNLCDEDGNTALLLASKLGATEAANLFINAGAKLDERNNEGRTAIQEAVKYSRKSIYISLKKSAKKINNVDLENHNLIFDAVDSQNIEVINDIIVNKLVKVDSSILFYQNTYSKPAILKLILSKAKLNLEETDPNGKSTLFYIVKKGASSIDTFMYALSLGLDINHVDKDGNTVLMELIKYINTDYPRLKDLTADEKLPLINLIDMIPWLIEEEINYNVYNNDGENVLTYVTAINNIDIMKILLEYGVDPNFIDSSNTTALSTAAMKGSSNIEAVSLLLNYGARPNITDNNNKTIIEKLITIELVLHNEKKMKLKEKRNIDETQNYRQVLHEILLNGEVNLTMLNSEEQPYFFDAVFHNNIDLVKSLAKYGADINQRDRENSNIVYKYMAENIAFKKVSDQRLYYIMLKQVITLGADVNARDSHGGITLHKAILDNDIQTIKIILNAGADINAVDARGRNMIHNCMWQNKVKVFRLILSFNKDLLNKPDKFGVLPINYAAFLGYTDLVVELIDNGAYINNPFNKTEYIHNFLKKFHKNLSPLLEKTSNPTDWTKLKSLTENMRKEFNVSI
ncbi:MAG: ankyrin repeat domain-containing protein [Campylobacteraceae bacterium]|nr:ankyrin repeat domain-containing protein [Campylobacteraceae bacterium]